jgi:hypothetical protein
MLCTEKQNAHVYIYLKPWSPAMINPRQVAFVPRLLDQLLDLRRAHEPDQPESRLSKGMRE